MFKPSPFRFFGSVVSNTVVEQPQVEVDLEEDRMEGGGGVPVVVSKKRKVRYLPGERLLKKVNKQRAKGKIKKGAADVEKSIENVLEALRIS